MKKYTIIIAAIIIAVAVITATVLLLTRDPEMVTISTSSDGQEAAAAGEASGTSGGLGTGPTGEEQNTATGGQGAVGGSSTAVAGESGKRVLNIHTYDSELMEAVKDYVEMHPEFNFKVNYYLRSMISESYFLKVINENMQSGSPDMVDIYCVPAVYSHEVIKGEFSKHAYTYKELGIDVDAAVEKADIPQYIIDAGRNPDGEVIALPFRNAANVFMYRRSVARDVWGTDDPQRIADIIGAGTGKWDRFLDAAKTLKEHGCYIIPGFMDINYVIDTSIQNSIMEPDEGIEINPEWQEFLDISKKMVDNGYIPKTQYYWTEEWTKALSGKGDKPVFGFIIPDDCIGLVSKFDENMKSTAGDWAICVPPIKAYVSNYTGILVNRDSPNKDALGPLIEWLTLDISEKGLQYNLANDTLVDKNDERYEFHGGKWSVISGTILRNTENHIEFLGRQNINPVIYDVLNTPTGRHSHIGLETYLFELWTFEIRAYLAGEKDREAAEADYKKAAKDMIGRNKDSLDEYGLSFLLP